MKSIQTEMDEAVAKAAQLKWNRTEDDAKNEQLSFIQIVSLLCR